MSIRDRMLKLRKVMVPLKAGSDPDVIEIDDCDNVYQLFPEIDCPCEDPDAPEGQCHFNAVGLEPDRCLYCGRKSIKPMRRLEPPA